MRTKTGVKVATRVGSGLNIVCALPNAGGGGRGQVPIDNGRKIHHPRLYSVRVILQTGPTSTGPWSKAAEITCVWKTPDCSAA